MARADHEATELETVIQDLLSGQYNNPIRVVAFNTEERWSEDVSEDVATNCAPGQKNTTFRDQKPSASL